ncbi:3-coathanger stack domain-containing protein [Candidatus Neomarinimicrobiota bacterium]
MKIFIKMIIVSITVYSSLFAADGNLTQFEPGAAVYRDLDWVWWFPVVDNHWHGGIFHYFKYNTDGTASMRIEDWGGGSNHAKPYVGEELMNTDLSVLQTIADEMKDEFRKNKSSLSYYGAYSNAGTPETFYNIVTTSNTLLDDEDRIDYCFYDMLEPIWGIWPISRTWSGGISQIENMRCDAVVEYSYEKHYVNVSMYNRIASSGTSHPEAHNDFHNGGILGPNEVCPKVQAGAQGSQSELFPLVAAPPTVTDPSYTQQTNQVQLGFKVSDNRSVKAYVLVQVKKTSEGTWRTLIDVNGSKWKFKEVNLTDYGSGLQYDQFYIQWAGDYDGGSFSNFGGGIFYDLRITVIDQGANYSITEHTITSLLGPDIALANMTITTSESCEAANSITAGPAFTIEGPGDVTIAAGNNVMLLPGFHAQAGSHFKASVDAGLIPPPLFAVSISGPDALQPKTWGTFTANVSGGSGEIVYQWYKNETDTWLMLGTASTQDYFMHATNDVNLKVVVTRNGETFEATKFVLNGFSIPKTLSGVPIEFGLSQNYPNPFNPSTDINFGLPKPCNVTLRIYDILGREIQAWDMRNTYGYQAVHWNSVTKGGRPVPSGIYIYRLIARPTDGSKPYVKTHKMLLLK